MKAILVVFAMVVAMSFASCGNSTKPSVSTNDSDTVVVDTDSVVADTLSAGAVDSAVVAK